MKRSMIAFFTQSHVCAEFHPTIEKTKNIRMKYIFILFLFCTNQLCAQSKFYDVEVNTLDNLTSSLKSYTGKKILIATGSPDYLQKEGIRFLDSLHATNLSLNIILIPVQDSASENTKEDIDLIRSNFSKNALVTAVAYVADGKSQKQNRLIKYLTDVKENTHFNQELNTDFNVYLVDESGVLYGVLDKSASAKTLNELLTQKDVTQ